MRALVGDLAHDAARRFGDAVALSVPGGASLTFLDIDDLAGRFAGGLAARGIGQGDRVVLHLPNGWQWIVAYHAIARLGAVVVPANILLSVPEVAFLTRDSGATGLLIPSERRAEIVQELGVELPALVVDDEGYEALLDAPWRAPADLSPDDLCTIGYTSGTTGRPKGAMLSHRCIFSSTALTATIHVRTAADRIFSALPFPHVYGNVVMNACFLSGARLVAPARFDAGEALATIGAERITLFEGVPTMYYQMLAHPDIATADLSTLTRCTVGGQTMPVAKLDAVMERFGCPLLELWGMTELGGPAVSHSPYWPARHGSIGLPFPGVEARIADLDAPEREAAIGHAGELMVRGPIVMGGYWKNPEATRQAIDGDGWLATGDIARRDADGYLTVVDRRKDLIITAGYNVYPAELEQVIAMHPGVAMVAVAGVPDDEKGELARAFVVRYRDATVDEAELLAHCRAHLAAYKVPRQLVFVEDLPRTSTGKIMRRALIDSVIPG